MIRPHTSSTNLLLLLAAILLPLASLQATITYTTGGTADATQGTVSSQAGSTAINFDNVVIASQGTTYVYTGGGTTGTFTGLTAGSTGSIVTGNLSGQYAAPTGDTTQYLAVGYPKIPETVTLTLSTPLSYFGLYWSTPDSYNTVSFYDASNNLLASFTPGSGGFIGTGTPSTAYVNFNVTSGNLISKVLFTTTNKSFEIDNLSFVIPEPSTWVLTAGSIIGLGCVVLRRKKNSLAA